MSGNSRSSCLLTAPIVSAFCRSRTGGGAAGGCGSSVPRMAASGADDERPLLGGGLRVERPDVAGVVELPGGRRVIRLRLHVPQERAALLAVVRPLAVDEPALGTVHYSSSASAPSGVLLPAR